MKLWEKPNLQIGDIYTTSNSNTGPWIVTEIVQRGVVSVHKGILGSMLDGSTYWIIPPGSHKHLDEWSVDIKL